VVVIVVVVVDVVDIVVAMGIQYQSDFEFPCGATAEPHKCGAECTV
jgi:hypothetical protein